MEYAQSPIRDFQSNLRIVVDLDEDDIQFILKQYNPNFITYETPPGIYTIKDTSEAVYTRGDHDGTPQIKYDDISMKTKLILTRFGSTFGTFRFVEKSYFNILLGFTPSWDSKPTNAIHAESPSVYTIGK